MGQSNYHQLKKDLSLQKYSALAQSKKGKFLPDNYSGISRKYTWECELGHQWKALPINIGKGKWCPTCAGNAKSSLQDCKDFAEKKNGKCLATNYVNAASPMEWQCYANHKWVANYNNIKSKNSWCPYCLYNGEKVTKICLENLLGVTFNKIKPNWLRNDEGNNLELDGFCEDLNLAFEFQGNQHYQKTFFTKDERALSKRKRDDQTKVDLCKVQNIKLLIIKQPKTLDIDLLELQIKSFLSENGISFNNKKISYSDYFKNNKIIDLQKLANSKGGKCLSDCYIASDVKLHWECRNGHQWKSIPYLIEKGHWCARCARSKK